MNKKIAFLSTMAFLVTSTPAMAQNHEIQEIENLVVIAATIYSTAMAVVVSVSGGMVLSSIISRDNHWKYWKTRVGSLAAISATGAGVPIIIGKLTDKYILLGLISIGWHCILLILMAVATSQLFAIREKG
jgi:MFS family permease